MGSMMASDFVPHARVYVAWPERTDTWRDNAMPAQLAFAKLVAVLARYEHVTLLVSPEQKDNASMMIRRSLTSRSDDDGDLREISMLTLPLDDAWVRDTGPTFITDKETNKLVQAVDWTFNAWGSTCFQEYENDDAVAARVAEHARVACARSDVVMEGGALCCDGEGTLLVTEECLLCANRNPSLSKAQIEGNLKTTLGVSTVIWLPYGLHGDTDTNGHVDNVACFAAPGKVLLAWEEDANDPQHARSLANLEALASARDARGRELDVIKVHQPPPIVRRADEAEGVVTSLEAKARPEGERLAASYINFYIGNGVIVAPSFENEHADARAHAILADAFPARDVVGLPAREFLLGGGGIHCVTLGEPER